MGYFEPLKNAEITVKPLSSTGQGGGLTFGSPQTISVRLRDLNEIEHDEMQDTVNVGVVVTTDEYEFNANDGIWLPGANTASVDEAYQPVEVTDDTTLGVTLSQALL